MNSPAALVAWPREAAAGLVAGLVAVAYALSYAALLFAGPLHPLLGLGTLATWLQQQPQVAQLLHPAFSGSPGHDHWRALCTEDGQGGGDSLAAGLFSVVFDGRYSPAQVDAFCDALRLFKLGYSWGGPVSLVVPYDIPSMRPTWPHAGVLVRFSIGLEAVEDLQADLAQALDALHSG